MRQKGNRRRENTGNSGQQDVASNALSGTELIEWGERKIAFEFPIHIFGYFDILSQNMNNMSCMYVRPIMKILSGKEVALIKSYGRSKSKNSHFFCALS